MVAKASTMLPLGTPAPDFALPDTESKMHTLEDFAGAKALVVAFICNHCPYVKHIQKAFVDFAKEFTPRGVAIVAINANDVSRYPDDAPEKMAEEARRLGYPFPYLFDETQEVAKAYRAACTPDFYVFDQKRFLAYRGQFDDSRPKNDIPPTGEDLRRAVEALLSGNPVPREQKPSLGCNIKWRPGKEPDYF